MTANGDDLLMLAIKTKNFDLLKYFLLVTIQNKYAKQLDFNNGNGDIDDEEDGYIGHVSPDQVDPNQRWKHKNSLM